MVGIKATFAPLPLCIRHEEEVRFFFFLPISKSYMRHGLLTGVCLNIKQDSGGLQMAGRLHSRKGLQSGPRGVGGTSIFAPEFWFSRGKGVQTSRPHYCHHYIVTAFVCRCADCQKPVWCWITYQDCTACLRQVCCAFIAPLCSV